MIDFEPTEEQSLMQGATAQLANTVRGRIRAIEAARGLPNELVEQALAMGLGGTLHVPETHGGAGLGMRTTVLLDEALSHADPAVPFALASSYAAVLGELGAAEQAQPLVGALGAAAVTGGVAWSEERPVADRAGFATRAERTGAGWTLHGEKAYVLHAPRAATFVVFAQIDPDRGWDGLGAFVVERTASGVSVGARLDTLGLDAADFASVKLEGVQVSDSARLGGEPAAFASAVVRFFVKEALRVAARAVGLAQAAFDVTHAYVSTRKAFGKPIGHFQAVAFTVADRAMDVDAARGLVWRAAALWDAHLTGEKDAPTERDALLASAYAISMSLRSAMRAADDAVQLHGGSGFVRDYPVEKMMRDAKQLGVTVMTAEQADQLAASIELGRPIDLALVLPTPESQSTFL